MTREKRRLRPARDGLLAGRGVDSVGLVGPVEIGATVVGGGDAPWDRLRRLVSRLDLAKLLGGVVGQNARLHDLGPGGADESGGGVERLRLSPVFQRFN